MERWRVADATALALIDYPGKLGAAGKRPRFRFTTKQRRITSYLAEIDAVLASAGKDEVWLHRKIGGPPFSRRSPIDHLVADGIDGATDVLLLLNRMARYGPGTTAGPAVLAGAGPAVLAGDLNLQGQKEVAGRRRDNR